MPTARYPKSVLLERIDAKIAGLTDEQQAEEEIITAQVRDYVLKTARAAVTLHTAFDELLVKRDEDIARLVHDDATEAERFRAARRIGQDILAFASSFPQPGWRMEEYERELQKVAKKYELKLIFLQGKRQIIDSAEAPDGFTMTALEKLHLLEAIG